MSLSHNEKHQKKNNDPFMRLMTPMIIGILVSVFCLVSMTWAWFTASVATPPQTIQSANRSTSVVVYEVSQGEGENRKATKKLIKPKTTEEISLVEDTQVAENEGTIIAGETAVWELAPEKTYEVIMTGSGTASTGYCEVELSHTASGSDTVETKLYKTLAFEKDDTVKFTYNTGGFTSAEGVTETQYKRYIENTASPTIAIASYWGKPAEEAEEQVSVMSLRDTSNEIMLLSDGDVLGLAPIPCPEAKAETEVELEGFELQEGAEISAEVDYQIALTLKNGYEMPDEVVVNIGGKDYVVSTGGSEASADAPYYNAETGVLTVPSGLLSDGVKVSVKATATPIPEEPEEEMPEEKQPEEETGEETEETTEDNEAKDDNDTGTTSNNGAVANTPNKKEDGEQDDDEPENNPEGDGDGDDDDDDNSGDTTTDDDSSSNENEEENEKADVKLNLSQLTINLEETQIPTNADLVLTLSAKEDMELPEQIIITLDKTIRDENIEDGEIEEDKTEYIINTDGEDNPDGFEFDAESGELTISAELLEGVREITITDNDGNEDENGEKAVISFEVQNLTFNFTENEIVTDEDIVITFAAGEGFELPETIKITIDGVEYIIYTSEEDSDKNPEGIAFDWETGTLTISKDLLEGVQSITITAEGVEKEDNESEDNSDTDNNDESENENSGADGGTDTPADKNETETEDDENTDAPIGGNGSDDDGDENGTEDDNPDSDSSTNTGSGEENGADGEQGSGDEGENGSTDAPADEDKTETEGDEVADTPDSETDSDKDTEGENDATESLAPDESGDSATTPESPKGEESDVSTPVTGGNDSDGTSGTPNTDSSSTGDDNSGDNSGTESNTSSDTTTSSAPSTDSGSTQTSQPSDTTATSSGSSESSSEE